MTAYLLAKSLFECNFSALDGALIDGFLLAEPP